MCSIVIIFLHLTQMNITYHHKLDTGMEKVLRSHIEQCFQILAFLKYNLEWKLEKTIRGADGITLMKGWYKITDANQNVIYHNPQFECGIESYLTCLRELTPEFCFQSCMARIVTQSYGFN